MTRCLLAALLTLAAVAGAGCGGPSRPSEAEIRAVAAEVEAAVEGEPGVSDVSVAVDTTLPVVQPSFSVTADTGTLTDDEMRALGLSILEQVWRAELGDTTSVTVYFSSDHHERYVYLEDLLGRESAGFFGRDLEALFGSQEG